VNAHSDFSTIRRIAALTAICAVLGAASAATAAEPAQAEPSRSAVWLVSTRGLSACEPQAAEQPAYWYLGQDGEWTPADAKTFDHGDDPGTPTVFFIHGNRFSRQEAIDTAWDVYQHLLRQAGPRPFRFVIWSWPSDRVTGRIRRDVQIKADRSDMESYWLADCIRRIRPEVPVSLMGYSFGVRPILGAFHLLAGGDYLGLRLPERPIERTAMRAVFVAAAADDTALLTSDASGSTLRSVDRLLVTCNPTDAVLRRYPHLERGRGPEAMGFTGPACVGNLGADGAKLEVLNVSCEVGRRHDVELYMGAGSLRARLAFYAFLNPPDREK
jgi:hypothetical protein